MSPPFRSITIEQFGALLSRFPFERRIDAVHMHHTWRPNHAQYMGHESIVGMWRFHTTERGWSDIAQHLTIAPDSTLWLGRDWNFPPASALGHNGTAAAGPFMFEMVGDFDKGRDPFGGAQRDAALRVVALVQDRFKLPVGSLRFHNQMSGKTCPGSAIPYQETLEAVLQLRKGAITLAEGGALPTGTMNALLFGEEGGALDEASAFAPAARPPNGDDLPDVDHLILALMGADRPGLGLGGGAASATPLLGAVDYQPGDLLRPMTPELFDASPEAESLRAPVITTDMKEALRAHVINLSRGRFSATGRYRTTNEDVDAIFGEDLGRAVASQSADDPLRIVIWAHGGLVDETSGLRVAHKHVRWWQQNGVYPLYFVWETGLLESLGRLIFGESAAPQGAFADRVSEFTDRRIETLARVLQGPAIWADMKQSARLASDAAEGGASYVARKLSEFCARHEGKVELHAVGHSAGAIFHARFLPAALRHGVPGIKTLSLLAPAIRIDDFREQLVPLVGADNGVGRLALFTMNKLRELDDTCLGLYRKSLLYLIHHALEEEQEAPILGLETCLREDAAIRTLFGLGGADRRADVDIVWSRSPEDAPLRSQSASLSHGGFDDDAPTMDSLLRRILGNDVIRLSYAGTEAGAVGPLASSETLRLSLWGDTSTVSRALVDDEFDVPFDVLDAFERAAELSQDGAEALNELMQTPAAGEGPIIDFGPNARATDVTSYSRKVLIELMQRANVSRVIISSTSRSPAEQARVMFINLETYGVARQKDLYGAAGDRVIDVYQQAKAAGQSPTAIKAAMTAEIIRIGPTRVSRHASDPNVLNVFDVAPSSVGRKAAFEQVVLADARVARFLKPPADPGYHLEIPQPPGGPLIA